MFLRKRTRIEIVAELLRLCGQPRSKTRLMYGANLSWNQTSRYLNNMLSLGLLEVHHSPTKYVITQKGANLLDRWRMFAEILVVQRIIRHV